ncbi:MAG: archaeal heat shock protein Hsp14 [Halobacteriaceae archaeon]
MTRAPFTEFDRLFDRMQRHFEDLEPDERGRTAVDVAESDDEFTITVDLPGYDREDIDLRIRDDTLHVTAEHEEEAEAEEEEEYLRKERRHRSVSRTIHLPAEIDEKGTEASYQNGVLTVTVPKVTAADAEEAGHHIAID